MIDEQLNVGVFMWFNKEINDYAEINYRLNDLYCKKYGYSIIKSNQRKCLERKFHWERIPLILENFDKYDYLIWIDADAHFYIDSPPITNVIDAHPEKIFIFSGDTDISSGKSLTCEINSGFFIVKKSEEAKNILTKWLKDNDLFKSPKLSKPIFGSGRWNDQAVLRLMYSENILGLKDNSIIIKYGILQHFNKKHKLKQNIYGLIDKPFLYHCTNGENMKFENRVKSSKEYYFNLIKSNKNFQKMVINNFVKNVKNNKNHLVKMNIS